jgi:predicted  nucleic acid-binding Zn-ribbon protein
VDIDDTIQVRCSRCKSKFRDKARRVRDGYSRQCPTCECMVFFLDGSSNKDTDAALREAERVRKLLRQEESDKIETRAESAEQTDDGDGENALARRATNHRSLSTGRARR